MNQSVLIKKILWLCICYAAYSVAGEPFGFMPAGEPLSFVRQPKVRLTPVYYDLIGIEMDRLPFSKWFEGIVKEAKNLPTVKDTQKKIDATQKKISDIEDRLKNLETLPEDIKKLEESLLMSGLMSSAEVTSIRAEISKKRADLANRRQLKKQLNANKKVTKKELDALKVEHKDRQIQWIRALLNDNPDLVRQIQPKCTETREKLKLKSLRLERELQSGVRLGAVEQMRKREELEDIQFNLQQSAHACPLLLNEKRRRAYNNNLAEAQMVPEGLIEAFKKGVERAKDDPPDIYTVVNDLAGKFLSEQFKGMLKEAFGDIPEAATKIFNQNIALRSIDFLPKPSGQDVRLWVGFSGLMGFNQLDLRVSMYLIRDIYGLTRMSIAIELPDYYKPSNLLPSLKFLDTFSLPKIKLIFSNFEYYDYVVIHKGLTLVAEVDYSGPLKVLSDLKDKSSYFKSLIFAGTPAVLSGYLPFGADTKPEELKFEVRVPLHLGFDLRKMSLVPTVVSQVINQVTTDDFVLTVRPRETGAQAGWRAEKEKELAREEERIKGMGAMGKIAQKAKGFFTTTGERASAVISKVTGLIGYLASRLGSWQGFNIEAEAGARIVLGTQPEPISLTLLGSISPTVDLTNSSLLVAANLKKMLELKWFALGDATIQFEWDTLLIVEAAALGIPFTGLGIKGRVDLGKPGETRAHLNAAGGFRVTTTKTPDVLFNLEGENIRFGDFLSYASYLASRARILKVPIPVEKIPTMNFSHVEGYLALGDMKIGRTVYPSGIRVWLESELFNKKFGLQLGLSDRFELSGFGYMPRIDARFRQKEIFKLYNSSQPDRGPLVSFLFDMQKPLEGYFNAVGALEVPALRLKQDVRFLWHGWMLDADFESSLAGISIGYGVRINTRPVQAKIRKKIFKEELPFPVKEEKELKGEELIKKLPERLQEIRTMEPAWKSLAVKFSFKDEFTDYMTKAATPLLRKMKDAALAKIKTAMSKLLELKAKGVKGFEAELARAQRSVARSQEKLAQAKSTCAKARWYKKYVCAKVAAQQSILLMKKGYLNALLKPTKAVATKAAAAATKAAQMSATAWRKTLIIQEYALSTALFGLELAKAGFSLFKLKEFAGEYSFAKNQVPIIKRLLVELNFFEHSTTISLYEVPVNFENLFGAIETITRQVLNSALGENMEYLEIAEELRR